MNKIEEINIGLKIALEEAEKTQNNSKTQVDRQQKSLQGFEKEIKSGIQRIKQLNTKLLSNKTSMSNSISQLKQSINSFNSQVTKNINIVENIRKERQDAEKELDKIQRETDELANLVDFAVKGHKDTITAQEKLDQAYSKMSTLWNKIKELNTQESKIVKDNKIIQSTQEVLADKKKLLLSEKNINYSKSQSTKLSSSINSEKTKIQRIEKNISQLRDKQEKMYNLHSQLQESKKNIKDIKERIKRNVDAYDIGNGYGLTKEDVNKGVEGLKSKFLLEDVNQLNMLMKAEGQKYAQTFKNLQQEIKGNEEFARIGAKFLNSQAQATVKEEKINKETYSIPSYSFDKNQTVSNKLFGTPQQQSKQRTEIRKSEELFKAQEQAKKKAYEEAERAIQSRKKIRENQEKQNIENLRKREAERVKAQSIASQTRNITAGTYFKTKPGEIASIDLERKMLDDKTGAHTFEAKKDEYLRKLMENTKQTAVGASTFSADIVKAGAYVHANDKELPQYILNQVQYAKKKSGEKAKYGITNILGGQEASKRGTDLHHINEMYVAGKMRDISQVEKFLMSKEGKKLFGKIFTPQGQVTKGKEQDLELIKGTVLSLNKIEEESGRQFTAAELDKAINITGALSSGKLKRFNIGAGIDITNRGGLTADTKFYAENPTLESALQVYLGAVESVLSPNATDTDINASIIHGSTRSGKVNVMPVEGEIEALLEQLAILTPLRQEYGTKRFDFKEAISNEKSFQNLVFPEGKKRDKTGILRTLSGASGLSQSKLKQQLASGKSSVGQLVGGALTGAMGTDKYDALYNFFAPYLSEETKKAGSIAFDSFKNLGKAVDFTKLPRFKDTPDMTELYKFVNQIQTPESMEEFVQSSINSGNWERIFRPVFTKDASGEYTKGKDWNPEYLSEFAMSNLDKLRERVSPLFEAVQLKTGEDLADLKAEDIVTGSRGSYEGVMATGKSGEKYWVSEVLDAALAQSDQGQSSIFKNILQSASTLMSDPEGDVQSYQLGQSLLGKIFQDPKHKERNEQVNKAIYDLGLLKEQDGKIISGIPGINGRALDYLSQGLEEDHFSTKSKEENEAFQKFRENFKSNYGIEADISEWEYDKISKESQSQLGTQLGESLDHLIHAPEEISKLYGLEEIAKKELLPLKEVAFSALGDRPELLQMFLTGDELSKKKAYLTNKGVDTEEIYRQLFESIPNVGAFSKLKTRIALSEENKKLFFSQGGSDSRNPSAVSVAESLAQGRMEKGKYQKLPNPYYWLPKDKDFMSSYYASSAPLSEISDANPSLKSVYDTFYSNLSPEAQKELDRAQFPVDNKNAVLDRRYTQDVIDAYDIKNINLNPSDYSHSFGYINKSHLNPLLEIKEDIGKDLIEYQELEKQKELFSQKYEIVSTGRVGFEGGDEDEVGNLVPTGELNIEAIDSEKDYASLAFDLQHIDKKIKKIIAEKFKITSEEQLNHYRDFLLTAQDSDIKTAIEEANLLKLSPESEQIMQDSIKQSIMKSEIAEAERRQKQSDYVKIQASEKGGYSVLSEEKQKEALTVSELAKEKEKKEEKENIVLETNTKAIETLTRILTESSSALIPVATDRETIPSTPAPSNDKTKKTSKRGKTPPVGGSGSGSGSGSGGEDDKSKKEAEKERIKQEKEEAKAVREYNSLLNKQVSLNKQLETNKLRLSTDINLNRTGKQLLLKNNEIIEEQIANNKVLIDQKGKLVSLDKKQLADAEYERNLTKAIGEVQSSKGGVKTLFGMMGQDIKRSFSRIFDYGIAARGLNAVRQKFQEILQITTALNKTMVNLQVVTGLNSRQATSLMKSYTQLGKVLGATTEEIASGADSWLRQGYSAEEARKLVTASTYLSKLGMIENGQATEYLTSMLKGYKLEAKDAMEVVSKLTKVDMLAAASAGDIAEALSKTAVSAQMAGLSLDTTIGYATEIIEVTQKSAESIGESLKTVFARYGNVKAGKFEAMSLDGESSEITEGVNDIERVLGKLGIRIRSSNKEFRSFETVLAELAGKWDTLSSVEKNAAATALGGARQRENILVLLENYDKAIELAEESANASGTAEEKYTAYSDSLEASTKRLTAAWEELTLRFEASPVLKTLTDVTTKLVEVFPKLIGYVATFFTSISAFKIPQGIKQLGQFLGLKTQKGLAIPMTDAEGNPILKQWGKHKGEQVYNKGEYRNFWAIKSQEKSQFELTKKLTGKEQKYLALSQQKKELVLQGKDTTTVSSQMDNLAKEINSLKQAVGENSNKIAENTGATAQNSSAEEKETVQTSKNTQEVQENSNAVNNNTNQGQKSQAKNITGLKPGTGTRILTGVTTGLVSGITSGASAVTKNKYTGETQEASKEAKIAQGVGTGIVTGGLAALGGPIGPILAMVAQPFLEGLFTKIINPIIDKEKIQHEEDLRVATQQLETLENLESTTKELKNTIGEDIQTPEQLEKTQTWITEQLTAASTDSSYITALNKEFGTEGVGYIGKLNEIALLSPEDRVKIIEKVERAMTSASLSAADTKNQDERDKLETDVRLASRFGDTTTEWWDFISQPSSEAAMATYTQKRDEANLVGATNTAQLYQKMIDNLSQAISALEAFDSGSVSKVMKNVISSSTDRELSLEALEEKGISQVMKDLLPQGGEYAKELERYGVTAYKDGELTQEAIKLIKTSMKTDSTLSQLLNLESRTLNQVVAMTESETRDLYLERIAETLGVSLEYLKQNLNKLPAKIGEMTAADLAKTPLEIKSDMESYSSILGELSSTGVLSPETTSTVLNNPVLAKYFGDTGDLIKELNILLGQNQEYFIKASVDNLKQNTNIFNTFLEAWKEKFGSGLNTKGNTLLSASEDIQKAGGEDFYNAFIEKYRQQFEKVATAIIETSIQDSVINYQSKLLDKQIDNLNEQKTALQDINKQREYELKLMKAKEALENAQQEKKKVWREDLGTWVMTTDQSKVQEAQKALEDVENQKTISELEQQIADLTVSKDRLADLGESKEMAELRAVYDAWLDGLELNQSEVIGRLETQYETFIKKTKLLDSGKEEGSSGDLATDIETEKANAAKALETKKQGWSKEFSEKLSGADTSTESGARLTQETVSNFIAGITDEDQKKYLLQSLFNVGGQQYSGAQLQSIGDTVSAEVLKKQINSFLNATEYQQMWKKVTDNKTKFRNGITTKEETKAADEIYSTALSMYKHYNSLDKNVQEVIQKKEPGWIDVGKMAYDSSKYLTKTPFRTKLSNHSWTYAQGTFGAEGPALINEMGTEGIITPQGTLTAFDGPHGVIPASITRNVAQLGLDSPRLVKELDSLTNNRLDGKGLQGNVHDESINANQILVQMNVDKGFDMDDFVNQLRTTVELNKQNHKV